MDYLVMEPGLARHDRGRAIARVAKRIEAIVIRALFPEMTAALVPILFLNQAEFDDTMTHTRIMDLAGRHDWLARIIDDVTAEGSRSASPRPPDPRHQSKGHYHGLAQHAA